MTAPCLLSLVLGPTALWARPWGWDRPWDEEGAVQVGELAPGAVMVVLHRAGPWALVAGGGTCAWAVLAAYRWAPA